MTLADLTHLARPDIHLNPDDTWKEYRNIVERAITDTPRNYQTLIGPSEVGNPCDACLISRLAGIRGQRDQATHWLPFIGTSVHEQLALIFAAANEGQRRARFLVETTVSIGDIGGVDITGHADLYDTLTGEVTDWKIVGVTKLRDVKRTGLPGVDYRVQAHLYGYGFTRRGLPCQRVRVAFLPRNARTLADAVIWHEPYDQTIALEALERANRFATWIASMGVAYLLTICRHILGHSCTRYGWTDPDAANRAASTFNDLVAS
jgi:hypothetical protein